ncbi:MAG: hypothetical protein ACTSQY_00895 [Candidatus Odinarchaeia archaeon]
MTSDDTVETELDETIKQISKIKGTAILMFCNEVLYQYEYVSHPEDFDYLEVEELECN